MGKAANPQLRERATKTLVQIQARRNVLCDVNNYNMLFHVSKAIMKSGCILDCYLQVILFIYSMKRYCIMLHSGIVRMNLTLLPPSGPTNRTIRLLIFLYPVRKS